jgi:catalase
MTTGHTMDCRTYPADSLKHMFVDIVQKKRIEAGERPALRTVFHKMHGAARGMLRMRPDVPEHLRVGLFARTELPVWVRFSSDIPPRAPDFKSTLGIAVKLFGVNGPKLIGNPADTTMDLLMQNHDVFFVATATDMCEFTRAGVVDGDYAPYLTAHPTTAAILDDMAKPVASVLGTAYWSIVPFGLGPDHVVKYKLTPAVEDPPLTATPDDRNYLGKDLAARLSTDDARFELAVQLQTDAATMPIDDATMGWDETQSPPIPVADLLLPRQDVNAAGQAEFAENLAFNIWRVPAEQAPLGSIGQARRIAYEASADQRRTVNGVALDEPYSPDPAARPSRELA